MLRQVSSILNYYKPLASWSFLVTIGITVINPELILALCTKLFLTGLLWLMLSDRKLRRRLNFYRISGVSDLKFFGTLFLIDSIITGTFITLIKGFI
ncbi:hypothetical protein [Winogradskyella sp. SYSU M77433]|uniref:hypothetical protein n=1 Tax=Winogradskyella sp. SYSU M77433 TaxID=3042722 RepID=UPI002481040D|nr:hypothetical protein [Winogradskyella sp. SYSU M77433]MDH7911237.1 hypothetical protein [Winogradskyella sp. SYSU M77433]